MKMRLWAVIVLLFVLFDLPARSAEKNMYEISSGMSNIIAGLERDIDRIEALLKELPGKKTAGRENEEAIRRLKNSNENLKSIAGQLDELSSRIDEALAD